MGTLESGGRRRPNSEGHQLSQPPGRTGNSRDTGAGKNDQSGRRDQPRITDGIQTPGFDRGRITRGDSGRPLSRDSDPVPPAQTSSGGDIPPGRDIESRKKLEDENPEQSALRKLATQMTRWLTNEDAPIIRHADDRTSDRGRFGYTRAIVVTNGDTHMSLGVDHQGQGMPDNIHIDALDARKRTLEYLNFHLGDREYQRYEEEHGYPLNPVLSHHRQYQDSRSSSAQEKVEEAMRIWREGASLNFTWHHMNGTHMSADQINALAEKLQGAHPNYELTSAAVKYMLEREPNAKVISSDELELEQSKDTGPKQQPPALGN